jgi:hypothetical protein
VKRRITFIFCLLAAFFWTAHAFVPHHHVDNNTDNNVMEEVCWNFHFHEGHHHADESEQTSDAPHHSHHLCVFSQMLPLVPGFTKIQVQEIQLLINLLSAKIDNNTSDFFCVDKHFQYPIFDGLPYYTAFFSNELGLRAPPTI